MNTRTGVFVLFCALGTMPGCATEAPKERPVADELQSDLNYRGGPVVYVKNFESRRWKDVELILNSTFRARVKSVEPGEEVAVALVEFTREDGTRFDQHSQKLLKGCVSVGIRIDCWKWD